ncbi:MAG: methyltransferase domain-containing protein [Planctomycetaceae bacterium]|nr:methyltransferase domain-containing protein [Planctomycetaceae bacterium]
MSTPSAFPELPQHTGELPIIPGGWSQQEFPIDEGSLKIHRPTDPDRFLDDPDVHRRNGENDYMPYWAFLWPAAIKMANVVARQHGWAGQQILELGAGLGLVGLAAMRAGAKVTFSDYDETALYLCRANSRLNGFEEPDTLLLDWRTPSLDQRFPVIMGCEVTYDAAVHSDLLNLLDRVLATNGICWLGEPGRFQGIAFAEKAVAAGLLVTTINEFGHLVPIDENDGFRILQLRKDSGTDRHDVKC